jgi:predicted RND superfamily exporter protein
MSASSPLRLFDRAGVALGAFVVRRRRLVIVVSLLAIAIASLGLVRARFSTDYRLFFSKEDPGLANFQRLESAFTKTDNVLFVVNARQGSVYDREPLAAVQALTEAGWKLPHATRVDSLSNFPHASADGDDIRVSALVPHPAAALSDAELERIRKIAIDEPLLFGSLVSRDGRTAAVNVTVHLSGSDAAEVAAVAEAARALVARVSAHRPGLDIRASGMVFVNDAFMQASVVDMGRMLPLMGLVMLVGMLLILRSRSATAALAGCIGASAAISMAVAGWLGYPLTPTSVAAPIIVLTVAIADGVHITLATMAGLRRGLSRHRAVADSVAHHFEAVTYTWLTTIVGFLCLNYSDAPPVRHLANMTSVGVTAAYLLSITLLPAALAALRLRAPAARRGGLRIPRWLPDLVIRWRRPILGVTAVVTIATGVMAARLSTNDAFIQYFDRSLAFRRDADFTMARLSGLYRVEMLVDAGAPQGVSDPTYLAKLDELSAWLRAQPEVDHVYSLSDVLRRVHQVAHGGAATAYALATTRAAAAEDLLLYELNLPAGLDLTDRITVDKSASRVSITIKDLSTRQLNAFVARAEGWLRGHAPPAMWAHATGPVVIFSQMSDRNARNMVQADFLSLGIILLCMVVLLRSFSLGVVSVILNVVPIIVGYGLWWLIVGDMNIVATIAASISLGIIVDDTIHFLTRYRQLRQVASAEAAIRNTMLEAGPAMLATGTILCLGFGVLTFSSFQMSSHLGWLSLIIIGIAPLCDLFVTPALVLLREPVRDQGGARTFTSAEIAVQGAMES